MDSTNKSPKYHFDQNKIQNELQLFFKNEEARITSFGARVNQTFEAFVFAQTIKWYKSQGWNITIVNPVSKTGKNIFRLKFSTRCQRRCRIPQLWRNNFPHPYLRFPPTFKIII